MIGTLARKSGTRTAYALVITLGVALTAGGAYAVRVKSDLTPTANGAGAKGRASLSLRNGARGQFRITAKHVQGGKSYDLVVGGVKVGALSTSTRGNGRAAFSTSPSGKKSLLGFDPRGQTLLVRDAQSGEDVLVGDVPDDSPDAGACCLADGSGEGEVECEDLSAADCTAAGGTPQTGLSSCLPDPCGGTSSDGITAVCCINTTHDDGTETDCEDWSAAACAAAGGTMVQASSCDGNPCQPAAPVDRVACCVAQGDENECEVMSTAACTAVGGTANAAATCDPNPCPVVPSGDTSACCVAAANPGDPAECEDLSAADCATAGGSAPADGSTVCDPNPCL